MTISEKWVYELRSSSVIINSYEIVGSGNCMFPPSGEEREPSTLLGNLERAGPVIKVSSF
jgi:hypothetical protein